MAFWIPFHVFLGKTELLALGDVKVDLMSDVCDNGRALDVVRRGWTVAARKTILPRQCRREMWICNLPERLPGRIGSVYWISRCGEWCK